MATISLTFLSRIRAAWEQAQGAVVAQFQELQTQLTAPLATVDVTAATVAALGVSIVPPFVASNFTGGGTQTWTVTAAQVLNWSYCVIGPRLLLDFVLNGTTVGGAANPTLQITLPKTYTAARYASNACTVVDNGVNVTGRVFVNPGQRLLFIQREDQANFAASATNTGTFGQLLLEVM